MAVWVMGTLECGVGVSVAWFYCEDCQENHSSFVGFRCPNSLRIWSFKVTHDFPLPRSDGA
jgi:hypothetical protein